MSNSPPSPEPVPWHRGITGYQWFVLAVASAGWVFDIYEGQIFNITRLDMLLDILPAAPDDPRLPYYGDLFLGVFLVGGALGGVTFGALADRFGRLPILSATILTYSVFSGLTYFAQSIEQAAALRFLVALGTGGEWSVGAALVAEVFPARARAQAGAIFHASSIMGTWLAGLAGMAVGAQWRFAYLLGVLPAVLILLVRARMVEPTAWKGVKSGGGLGELLSDSRWRRRALLGLLFGATGLGMFWGVTVAGQDLVRQFLERGGVAAGEARATSKFAYSIVETTGGGLGLLAFGPLCVRWGRRRTFLFFQAVTLLIVPITCYLPTAYWHYLALLPLYGFFTLGIHAGFAVYFPELFPTRLRATAAGFCFNGGRLLSAVFLVFSGWLKAQPGIDLQLAVTLLSLIAVPGIILVCLLPETKGQPLPE
ncbi:MAG: MFS transporter [Gemmataceae bacterium]|nr:MFS transporter [Gemmataceae bacterium]